MPLSRNARTDRRRRVMREAVAADAEVAVESIRAKQRRRLKAHADDDDEEELPYAKRDPGYSQAVRKTCQQRVVQLIPVRRMSLSIALMVVWGIWLSLMLAHYLIHVRNVPVIAIAAPQQVLPIAYLFHLRSTHGIAHWLGGQLWLLTAIASFMIFRLRRHKLDDYRAKYRLWAMVAIAALFSSMDASTSSLYLFGRSIDTWAIRETGYSGWAIVLATFATLIGLLGLRLCTEFKSTPLSLLFWLGGLVSWAASAVLGTGLLKITWTQPTIDMVVGGAWLGGILSVFLATGIYLRHIYIEAQRRFIVRNHLIQNHTNWRMPRLEMLNFLRRHRDEIEEAIDESNEESNASRKSKASEDEIPASLWRRVAAKMPNLRREKRDTDSRESDRKPTRAELRSAAKRNDSERDADEGETESPARTNSRSEDKASNVEKEKRNWLRLPKWKSDPKLGDDYSDVDADVRKRDEGFEEPFGKKPGWFQGKSKSAAVNGDVQKGRSWWPKKANKDGTNSGEDDSLEDSKSMARKKSKDKESDTKASEGNKKALTSWFRKNRNNEKLGDSVEQTDTPKKEKKSWAILPKRGEKTAKVKSTDAASKTEKAERKKWFGLLDGLKLKPPKEGVVDAKKSAGANDSSRATVSSQSGSNNTSGSQRPVGPSSSSALRQDSAKSPLGNFSPAPKPAANASSYDDDEDEDEDGGSRNLSKAERKRMRRQQDGRRSA